MLIIVVTGSNYTPNRDNVLNNEIFMPLLIKRGSHVQIKSNRSAVDKCLTTKYVLQPSFNCSYVEDAAKHIETVSVSVYTYSE